MASEAFETLTDPTRSADGRPPHAVPASEALATVGVDPERGLRGEQVLAIRKRFGFNELAETPPVPLWRKFLGQFTDLVIWILIVAAIISGLMGEWLDTIAILAIVLLNGVLGFVQEERAEQSLAALRKLSAPMAKIFRDGMLRSMPARELVPGDVIDLEAGDNIPADARLIQSFDLEMQESALTGESVPVEKDAASLVETETPLADRRNMVYLGTVAATGKAKAVVIATGMRTELGRIAGLIQRYHPEPTPLQRRLAEVGKYLIFMCLAAVALIFALQLLRGGDLWEVFLVSVSLAVAAVPEGLPAVVTTALALGLQRMVRRNALIRKLPSVETLGSVTVICSDKTGTLTRNEMTVREIVTGGNRYRITGVGYSPKGEFRRVSPDDELFNSSGSAGPEMGDPVEPSEVAELQRVLTIGARCNHAHVSAGDGVENWQVIGDPTEGALVVAALKAGIEANHQVHRAVHEIPFNSERKTMSVAMRDARGQLILYTKGAPEAVLARCSGELCPGGVERLTDSRRREIMEVNFAMASRALRVLALAYRDLPDGQEFEERDLIFAGLVGMIDPPRAEAREAVQKCHDAGIRPVMITGDHPATALAIARELQIATATDHAVTGAQLDALSDEQLSARVADMPVYARVSAEHKLRVIRAWKSRHDIVAMTGDGVNDAPAIKAADIGIAMGISGADVTKEAAAMVLTDDNFASIVNAVEEGRCIYSNIQNILLYLMSCNVGELLLMLLASLVGWPAPLLPIQLLWVNLVTDGLPALALTVEKPEPDIMKRKPRAPGESIFSGRFGLSILVQGSLVGCAALIAFGVVYLNHPIRDEAADRARTIAFCVLVFAELLRALAARSQRLTVAQLGVFSNPLLLGAIGVSFVLQISIILLPFTRPVFQSEHSFTWEWILLPVLALIPVTGIETLKILSQKVHKSDGA